MTNKKGEIVIKQPNGDFYLYIEHKDGEISLEGYPSKKFKQCGVIKYPLPEIWIDYPIEQV